MVTGSAPHLGDIYRMGFRDVASVIPYDIRFRFVYQWVRAEPSLHCYLLSIIRSLFTVLHPPH